MIDSPVPASPAPAASSRSDLFRRGARLIGRSLRAHPVPHGIAIVGGAAFAVAVIALSRALGWVTDEVVVPGLDEGVDVDVWGAVGLVMAVGVFRGLGAVVRRYFLAVAEFRTEGTWRSQLNGQYLDLPLAEIESRPTGELLAHVDNDLTVAGMVLKPLAFTFATLVLAALALVSLWLVHPLFFAVALVVFPALVLMNHLYTTRVEGPAARAQAAVGEVSAIAHESFDGVLVVKTLGRESEEVERLRRASDRLRGERIRVGRLRAVFEPALDALPNLGIVALVAVGAWLVSDEAISVGDVVGATALFTILALPIRIVGFFLEEMPKSVVALDRIDRILDLPRPAEREGSVVLPDRPLDVAFEQVRFSWEPGTPVLDGVTFDVPAGSSVALVGSTGVGKSTLSELLVGLLPIESGTIRIGGVDLADVTPASLAASVALVFQETFLFAESVAENIRLGADASDETLRDVCELVRAHEFITALPEGYDTVVGERGVTLSGGQRQRIALARALVRSPRVLFLDDATSAVDPSVEASILGNLRRELDLTLLVGAHRLSTIRLADRVVYLADGRVAGIGSHAELLADPGYEALVRAYEEDRA